MNNENIDKNKLGSIFNSSSENETYGALYSSSDLCFSSDVSAVSDIKVYGRGHYLHSYSKQVIKSTELDTIGSSSISEDINRMLARGELDKFLRESQLQSFRLDMQQSLSGDDLSILNVRHADLYDLNTYYNKIIVQARKTHLDILNLEQERALREAASNMQAADGSQLVSSDPVVVKV